MTVAGERDPARAGLGSHWLRLRRTRVYVSPHVISYLALGTAVGYTLIEAVHGQAAYSGAPMRRTSPVDGAVAVTLYELAVAVRVTTLAWMTTAVGGRVVRIAVGGVGTSVRIEGLEGRMGRRSAVTAAGALSSVSVAAVLWNVAGGATSVRVAAAVAAGAGTFELLALSWRSRRWSSAQGRCRT